MFLTYSGKDIVYFKQYGEMRTGTNFFQKVVERNFSNVNVFASQFGWKHGLYEIAPKNHHFAKLDASYKSHKDWIDRFITVPNYDKTELIEISNRLNYIVSIKDFSDWVYSIGRWTFNSIKLENLPLDKLAKRFIYKYQLWDRELKDYRVIHFNTLLDENATLDLLETLRLEYGLIQANDTYEIPRNVVNANHKFVDKKFNPSLYLNKEYLNDVTDGFKRNLFEMESLVKKYLPPKFQREVL